jgi:hypothetical protein
MPIDPDKRQHLAAVMERRRLELRLTWQEVAERGGISLRALSSARTGPGDIRPLTRRGIDKGLGWTEGSGVDRILAGRDPLPAPGLRREDFARMVGLAPDSPFVVAVAEQVDRAIATYGEDVRGTVIFGGDPAGQIEAGVWDSRYHSRDGKVAAIALLRSTRAGESASPARRNAGLIPLLTLAGR